ncbi:MAG: hypothetical protein WD266_03645 [Balneolales bacterium]
MITIQIGKLTKAADGYLDQITRLEFDNIQEAISIWNRLASHISKEIVDHLGQVYTFAYQMNLNGECIHYGYSH